TVARSRCAIVQRALDPLESFQYLCPLRLALSARVTLDEGCCDGGGQHCEEGDTDQHQDDADDAAGDALGGDVSVSDGRDRNERPPDAVPDGRDVCRIDGGHDGAGDDHDEADEDGEVTKTAGVEEPLTGLEGTSAERAKADQAEEPQQPKRSATL